MIKTLHGFLSRHPSRRLAALSAAALATGLPAAAFAGQLTINSIHSDPTARKAFDAALTKFKEENKDVTVKVNTIDHESYKIQIRTWLPNNPPDVATWFAGNRARFFVERKLIEPIDDVWKPVEGQFGEGAKAVVTYSGKKYLMPVNYYHWGFFYRKDLFDRAGVKAAPATWEQFTDAVEKLKAQKITPVAIGTKQAWPSAAWFDFINMRVNGLDFHARLLAGKESYSTPKVKKAMETWGKLIRAKAFPENAAAMTWQEASALLWQGKAGMYLMGNFLGTEVPADLKDKIGFFGFPSIDPDVPSAQVAPTDVFFIPAKAKNKTDAKKFIAFMARADVQALYNDVTGLIPPNRDAKLSSPSAFTQAGQKLLGEAKGLSQFFDRDAEPEVAKVGMDGFVEFMSHPDRLDTVLARMEATRKRVHK